MRRSGKRKNESSLTTNKRDFVSFEMVGIRATTTEQKTIRVGAMRWAERVRSKKRKKKEPPTATKCDNFHQIILWSWFPFRFGCFHYPSIYLAISGIECIPYLIWSMVCIYKWMWKTNGMLLFGIEACKIHKLMEIVHRKRKIKKTKTKQKNENANKLQPMNGMVEMNATKNYHNNVRTVHSILKFLPINLVKCMRMCGLFCNAIINSISRYKCEI